APVKQPANDGAAEEAAAARHQGDHASSLAAQIASFSRKILALWRISTGKDGWKRMVVIARVSELAAPRESSSWRSVSSFTVAAPGSRSTQSTGSTSPLRRTPTRAVRFTAG